MARTAKTAGSSRVFQRILVPHDFSTHASNALALAAGLAGTRGRLTVLHAVMPVTSAIAAPAGDMMWTPPPEMVRDLQRQLETQVARVLGRRAGMATCRVVVADPLTAILAAARGVDSIVMATMGRTGLAHLVMGSVAEKVVRHSPVPVLTVRPKRHGRRVR